MPARFPLGATVITRNALNKVHPEDIPISIARHVTGDWGELDAEDLEANEDALQRNYRLLSVYIDRNGVKFWIITEGDRSVTTILLPEDY